MNRMAGKCAIVTGGGGGIGGAVAELFCAEGAKVLLVERDAGMLDDTLKRVRRNVPGAVVEGQTGDVSDYDLAVAAVSRAVQAFGGLNVLINNAAIRNINSLEKTERRDWDALFSVNLMGSVNFSKAALGALRKSGNASVINVSSINGLLGRKDWAIYDATKAAMLALTRTLACEEGENGIRVNAVCPSATLTPFTVGRAKARGKTEQDLLSEKREDNLLKRWAKPVEMAYPILFLASDEASYITGTTLMIDGGRSIVCPGG